MSEIDVSKCMFYQECFQYGDGEEEYHICNCYKNPTAYCQDSYNCYFKQRQQLQAENEELRNLHINLVGVKECEIKELIKYKQCLDDIEKIATVGYEGFCPKCSKKDCEDNNCYETAIIDILDKIKEVKGNG